VTSTSAMGSTVNVVDPELLDVTASPIVVLVTETLLVNVPAPESPNGRLILMVISRVAPIANVSPPF
ncbi:hypothetical protein ABTI09_20310, partial [Acinetobacter baumannii]